MSRKSSASSDQGPNSGISQTVSSQLIQVFQQVLSQAQHLGQRYAEIHIGFGSVCYSFLTPDGRSASGNISAQMESSLREFVEMSGAGSVQHSQLESGESIRISLGLNGNMLRVELARKEAILDTAPSTLNSKVLSGINKSKSEPCSEPKSSVLVIEDNLGFARVLERFFARQELSVLALSHADQALQHLQSGEALPKVIVCDVHMPGIGGIAFLKELKANRTLKNIPVLMLTSDTTVETELRCIEAGAEAFLGKSEDPRLLCAQVRRLVSMNARGDVA